MAFTPLIAGNWKMNGLPQDVRQIHNIRDAANEANYDCELLICPPAALIMQFSAHAGDRLKIGAQDCHFEDGGAYTGDHAASLLKAAGARYVIVGHSERRRDYQEKSPLIAKKALAAQKAGLMPIICVGETLEERDAGQTLEVVIRQVTRSTKFMIGNDYVIAYEPIWAVGTGKTPTLEEVSDIHHQIREKLVELDGENGAKTRILYGGSMKPANAKALLALENVNGGLIGGASLKADDFMAIAACV